LNILKKLFYLFLPIILGSVVGVIISGSIDYKELIKPFGAPPSWLFPVLWSIIYLLMGISYFILKKDGEDSKVYSVVYYLQLFINLFWSIIFFTLKLRLLAIIWIIVLDLAVIAMIYLFYNKKKVSAYLNILYLVWILYATYLTIGIYLLN
jgi:tryptophan-rich sensory protein